MKEKFSQKIIELANRLDGPLYAVGGVVRNYLIDRSFADDVDLCAPVRAEQFLKVLKGLSFTVLAEYKKTGTVLFSDGQRKYEYTAFRFDSYNKGEHTPFATQFTEDIFKDCKRRDFKCNAVYYDIAKGEYVDPLGGIKDVKNRVLDTVDSPDKVFCSDGLRLMRLARFSGELGFTPTKSVNDSAKKFSDNILDVSVERICAELKLILRADEKYPFSSKTGHFDGLKILLDAGVLGKIFRVKEIKADALDCLLRADSSIRLPTLIYKIQEGKEKGARELLDVLKIDNKTKSQTLSLIEKISIDKDLEMSEGEVRLFLVKNRALLDKLLKLKVATSEENRLGKVNELILKWQAVDRKMKEENAPTSIKELNISAQDLADLGLKGKDIGKTLDRLFEQVVLHPEKNNKNTLITLV